MIWARLADQWWSSYRAEGWGRWGLTSVLVPTLLLLFTGSASAADVFGGTGDMSTDPLNEWTFTANQGTTTGTRGLDSTAGQYGVAAPSLTYETEKLQATAVEWWESRSLGTINASDTVSLSLWYGYVFGTNVTGAGGTLYVDFKPSAGVWTNVWSVGMSAAAANAFEVGTDVKDISSLLTTDDTYEIRLRVVGTTGNNRNARLQVNWDDIIVDVTGAACTHVQPTVTLVTADQGACQGGSVNYTFTVTNNDTGACPNETFSLGYADSDAANFTSSGPASISLDAGQTSGNLTMTVDVGGTATGTNTSTITASLGGHTDGTNSDADTTADTTPPGNLTWSTITPGDSQIQLSWNNPGAGSVLILREQAALVGDTPLTGVDYSAQVGNQIGNAYIIYVGTGTSVLDNGPGAAPAPVNDTNYYYKLFVYDSCFNYSSGTDEGPHTPTAGGGLQTVIIRSDGKDGTDDAVWDWAAGGGTNFLQLGDQNDATFAQAISAGTLRSTLQNSLAYECKVISQITVNVRVRRSGSGQGDELVDFGIWSGSAEYLTGSPFTPTTGWVDQSTVWTTRPWDSQAWTPADIDNLVASVTVTQNGAQFRGNYEVSEIWVDVEYDSGSNTCAALTIGDGGSEAGNASPCPGAGAAQLDTFTLEVDTGAATVTAIEVSLAAGTGESLSTLEIRNAAGETPAIGSATPSGDTVNVTGLNLSVNTSPTTYTVWVTPKLHATMPSTPGYIVTGTVSDVTTADAGVVDNDNTSSTITIDNFAPNDPGSFVGIVGDNSVRLTWSVPGSDFDEVVILRKDLTAVTDTPSEGADYTGNEGTVLGNGAIIVYVGTATSFDDDGSGAAPAPVNGTVYHYKIFSKDPCGNYSGGAAAGPYTPASLDGTEGVSDEATLSSCEQITVTTVFTGDLDEDGWTEFYWGNAGDEPGTPNLSCAAVSGPSPRECLVTDFTGTPVYVRVKHQDPDGVSGNDNQIYGPFSPSCGTDTEAPTVLFLAPSRDAVVGGTERFRVQVFDQGGLAGGDPVEWDLDGAGLWSTVVTENTNMNCGPGCTVYEIDIDTTPTGLDLANGNHYLEIRVTDAEPTTPNVARTTRSFVVNNTGVLTKKPAGDGYLLRRSHSSGLCTDCHAVQTHSSQYSSRKYGNWALECLSCHTPHGTTNIHLIREEIETPNSGKKSGINLQSETPPMNSNVSFLGDVASEPTNYGDGVCEACHTRTTSHRNTSAADHAHNAAHATQSCTGCHQHGRGFKGPACNECHDAPPTVGEHGRHDEVWDSTPGNTATTYSETGSHAQTDAYGFACAMCHTGTHTTATNAGTDQDPFPVDVVFDSSVDPGSAAYDRTGQTEQTDQGPDGSYWSYFDGSCSNVYCHSSAARSGAVYMPNLRWESSANTTCTSCHGEAGTGPDDNTGALLSGAHETHLGAARALNAPFGCVRCHAGTVDSTISEVAGLASSDLFDKSKHVDGTRTVQFDSTSPDNSGGGYTDSPGFTCANTYCHSDGQERTGDALISSSPAWTVDKATNDCTYCHTAGGSGTSLSFAHEGHTSASSGTGEAFGCVQCHSQTVTDNTTIGTPAQHVDGQADVLPRDYDGTNKTFTPGASEGQGSCGGNIYCHSDGNPLADSRVYDSPNWNETPEANVCTKCHGTGTATGAPDHASAGAGVDGSNSHIKHVGSSADCATCHYTTTTDGTGVASVAEHINGSPLVAFDPGNTNVSGATFTASNKTCGGLGGGCHSSKQWGGASLVCLDCHGDPTTDFDSWKYEDGASVAKIAENEWTYSGHGKASGTYDATGNSAAAFAGPNPCEYCHDPNNVGHNDANNPFRLRVIDMGQGAPSPPYSADDFATTCLACHKDTGTNDPGVDPDGGGTDYVSRNSEVVIDAYHHGDKHATANNGGRFCWDCHDPHGDSSGAGGNVAMIQREVTKRSDDVTGIPYESAPDVYETVPVSLLGITTFDHFVDRGTFGSTTKICNACHGTTDHFTATSGDDHKSAETPPCSNGACHAHAQPPDKAFSKPSGQEVDCLSSGCHDQNINVTYTDGGALDGESFTRRTVTATSDFSSKKSHHIGSGSLYMGGQITAWDCIVCHAEGEDQGGTLPNENSTLHFNKKIDLYDADDKATIYSYDVDSVRYQIETVGGGGAADWNSSNSTWRYETSGVADGNSTPDAGKGLDRFCISCHDADGAIATYNTADAACDPAWETNRPWFNPFCDGSISNDYDQKIRYEPPAIPTSVPPQVDGPIKVIDVKSQVLATTDADPGIDPFGKADPPGGIYSRHAIRGMSESVYDTYDNGAPINTIYENSAFTAMGIDENSLPLWNDTSVMGCADCHTVDGSNTTQGNAHGSDSEYLLKDSDGTATLALMADVSKGNTSYICYRCHEYTKHGPVKLHTGSNSDYKDSVGAVGPENRNTGSAMIFGIACLNCHGAPDWGTIHGTSQDFERPDQTVRQSYRFMNGGSQRYYVEGSGGTNGWEGTSITCWTIGGTDDWSACTQHSNGYVWTKPLDRPLRY